MHRYNNPNLPDHAHFITFSLFLSIRPISSPVQCTIISIALVTRSTCLKWFPATLDTYPRHSVAMATDTQSPAILRYQTSNLTNQNTRTSEKTCVPTDTSSSPRPRPPPSDPWPPKPTPTSPSWPDDTRCHRYPSRTVTREDISYRATRGSYLNSNTI